MSGGHCTVLLHPIMPLAPWTPCRTAISVHCVMHTHTHTHIHTYTHKHKHTHLRTPTADGSPSKQKHAVLTQTPTLQRSAADHSPPPEPPLPCLFMVGIPCARQDSRFSGSTGRDINVSEWRCGLTGSAFGFSLKPPHPPWSLSPCGPCVCLSPGSGWERARAAAPSHPGLVLRSQPVSARSSLWDNLLASLSTSRYRDICVCSR